MISIGRPSPRRIEEYRTERVAATPTCTPGDEPPTGFRHESFSRVVGAGAASFERARQGLEQWAAHRRSGVEVHPHDAALVVGSTVALLTRQARLWVLAACRVVDVTEEPTRFGFVYATLPDHPECGYESFTVGLDDGEVTFRIDAVSRPRIPLVRLGAPVTRVLQRRATNAYLDALEAWVRDDPARR